jgi:metallophosphoesterase (TIGR03767 family)
VKFTRRNLIRSSAVAAGGATAALGATKAGAASLTPFAPAQTVTSSGTLVRAATPVNSGGFRKVVAGPAEPHLVRAEAGAAAAPGRAGVRVPVIAFAQLSDVHVVDAQSPMRLEFVDRLEDPSPLPGIGLLNSSHRAHEMLTGQTADAMVREINAIGAGPVTGKPLGLAIQTGDNSDNSQYNEVRWNIGVLNGGQVRVDSGSQSRWEGVADGNSLYYDPGYWHPHGTPAGKPEDVYRKRYGFPVIPGLLDRARAPFTAAGLNVPWYSAFGNHDGLVQGNFPQNLQLSILSTSALKVQSLPASLSPAEIVNSLVSGDLLGIVRSLALTPMVRAVTPDINRRLLNRKNVVEQHFAMGGAPFGHGFTNENRTKGTAYYSFDQGVCRFIVMDTVNPNGYSDGSIDRDQFAWLQNLLANSAGRICMIFSHHTSWTMQNTLFLVGGELKTRINGKIVLAELLKHKHVVAWINGHTHKNRVQAHSRPQGGGMWEINTASHIDWPQQSRIIEIADNQDGTLSIFTTMVDHAGPIAYDPASSDPVQLAGLGRELAANDPQDRTDSGRGQVGDRNLELLVQRP